MNQGTECVVRNFVPAVAAAKIRFSLDVAASLVSAPAAEEHQHFVTSACASIRTTAVPLFPQSSGSIGSLGDHGIPRHRFTDKKNHRIWWVVWMVLMFLHAILYLTVLSSTTTVCLMFSFSSVPFSFAFFRWSRSLAASHLTLGRDLRFLFLFSLLQGHSWTSCASVLCAHVSSVSSSSATRTFLSCSLSVPLPFLFASTARLIPPSNISTCLRSCPMIPWADAQYLWISSFTITSFRQLLNEFLIPFAFLNHPVYCVTATAWKHWTTAALRFFRSPLLTPFALVACCLSFLFFLSLCLPPPRMLLLT